MTRNEPGPGRGTAAGHPGRADQGRRVSGRASWRRASAAGLGATDLAADLLVQRIRTLVDKSAGRTVVVALDGRSGAGKSTLAAEVGRRLGALVVDGDDFYTGGPDDAWAAMVAAEKVDRVIDWRRQRDLLARLGRARP